VTEPSRSGGNHEPCYIHLGTPAIKNRQGYPGFFPQNSTDEAASFDGKSLFCYILIDIMAMHSNPVRRNNNELMPVVHQKPSCTIWLMLLMAIVLGVSLSSQASLAECQQIEIKPDSRSAPDTSGDDYKRNICEQVLIANEFQSFSRPNFPEGPVPVTNSGAYASLILHGPPATHSSL